VFHLITFIHVQAQKVVFENRGAIFNTFEGLGRSALSPSSEFLSEHVENKKKQLLFLDLTNDGNNKVANDGTFVINNHTVDV
jgi:hypothetical protein